MSNMSVVIIDYGMGNTMSVKNTILALGAEAEISREPSAMERASHIILPGVGAFGDGMANLRKNELLEPLRKVVFDMKKPFLGICLGMQMLVERGEENGNHEGLGFIKGVTRRFQVDEKKFHVPHIGWNDVAVAKENPLFANVHQSIFYFDHGYVVVPDDPSLVIATCDHGEKFAAAISADNIWGVQFHPEKSQNAGMALLGNFLEM